MSCELRCQTCLVNQDVTLVFYTWVCQPVGLVCLSQQTTYPSVSLQVCIDSSCLCVPHLLHCHVYLASVGIFLDSFKDIQHKQTL